MPLETSYTGKAAGSGSFGGSSQQDTGEYWPLSKLKKCYTDYLFSKRAELDEQIDARRYYHGSQWTSEQIAALKKRKQPIMTFNRIARKIDGVVGLIEKLRQDPKAYARTPQHAEGAELATATLRYVLDEQEWKAKSPIVAQDGAIDGIGGIEIELEQGDQGDPEVGIPVVDTQAFFYDPRSYKDDFSDARYQGVGKWVDDDIAKEMFPDADISAMGGDFELINNSDRQIRWFSTEGVTKRVRMVDIWYKHKGGWCWAIFTGSAILAEGRSYLKDEKGKDYCKYIMFSGNVDQDGDRYGFIRNMKSAQDGINAKQSKMQHILASKRLFISSASGLDVENARAEMARNDGVIVTHGPVKEGVMTDDQSFDFAGWTKMLELNNAEIERFGPNPELVGEQSTSGSSGRAIQLLQQAGMAELGPYIQAYRAWKIRVYRGIWNAVQQHWKAERWVRVTDDQGLGQFIQINGLQNDPQTGKPAFVNQIGALDVDIIMDEGPDHVNSMADVYETLSNILPSVAPLLNPVQANNVINTLIETSPLPGDVKKKFLDQQREAAQQPPPPDPAVEAKKAMAEIDAKTKLADQELAERKAAQDMEANKAKAVNEIEIARIRAQNDIEIAREKANSDIEVAHIKAQNECEIMKTKNAIQLDGEQHKANVQLRGEQDKAEIQGKMRTEEHKLKLTEMERQAKVDTESDERKAANDKAKADNTEPGQMKQISKSIETAMKANAEALKELAAAMKTPRQIKVDRDSNGRVIGARG